MSATPDFFISYNSADQGWAEWIGWQLEKAGYIVVIQAWDFRPGSNFVLEMDRAAGDAKRTLVVLSPHFVASRFTQPEWAAAFAKDPTGTHRTIVPVLIAETEIPGGLLDQIVHINLIGLDPDAAASTLIAGLNPGRSKPSSEPAFPGAATGVPRSASAFDPGLDWRTVGEDLRADTRDSILPRGWPTSGPATLEISLIPVEGQAMLVSHLQTISTELVGVGRDGGLFPPTAAVDAGYDSSVAYARAAGSRDGDAAGLLVTRGGQRTAWITLPHDGLGSIVDADQLIPRVSQVLHLLMVVEAPLAERYAFTVTVQPEMMVIVGDSSTIGRRNSASMRTGRGASFPTSMPDSVRGGAISTHADELAGEVVARVLTALR
ncbi:toll/interleukin-1 receptor domain-containing protein [Microbacterium paraoxydans]|uniref:toll/interleukin-1 receptor domain-containing protein n=1 Tax=Microbacterium paraoxydans TaxID=199592 RepID=UPI001CFBFA85|nr:toll/interleukin-1 receptor domain-containing protein [Microbacterium paraoxydans]